MNRSNNPAPSPGGAKLILVALGLALAAVVVTNLYIEQIKQQVTGQSFTVYRLTKAVAPGHKLAAQDVDPVSMPDQYRDAFKGFVGKDDLTSRLNDTLRRSADQGEFLTFAQFTAPGGVTESDVPTGLRRVTLPVNSRNAPASLRPGNFVDIYAFVDMGGAIPTLFPVIERTKIVGLGSQTESDEAASGAPGRGGNYRTITVDLYPDDAEQIAMISRVISGDFELQVRNPNDVSLTKNDKGGINPALVDLMRARSAPGTAPVRGRAAAGVKPETANP